MAGAAGGGLVVHDIGGRALAGGGTMRTGLLYRISGSLVGGPDLEHLSSLRLRMVVDLRGDWEDRAGIPEWAASAGVRYRHDPVPIAAPAEMALLMEKAGESAEAAAAVMVSFYHRILDEFGPVLAAAVEAMAGHFPAGFGCAAGKDRTGVLTALLQDLAGMSHPDIVLAYTEMAPDPDRLRAVLAAYAPTAGLDLDSPGLRAMRTAPAEAIEDMLRYLTRTWGGAAGYLAAQGLPAGTVGALRTSLRAA